MTNTQEKTISSLSFAGCDLPVHKNLQNQKQNPHHPQVLLDKLSDLLN